MTVSFLTNNDYIQTAFKLLLLCIYLILNNTTYSTCAYSTPYKKLVPSFKPHANYRQGPQHMSPWMEQFFTYAASIPDQRARNALQIVLQNPSHFRFQLLITEVEYIQSQQPKFTVHDFRVDHPTP